MLFFYFTYSVCVASVMLEAHYKGLAEQKELKLIQDVVQIYGRYGATLFDIFSTFEVLYDRPLEKWLLRKSIEIGNIFEIPGTGRLRVEDGDPEITIYDLLGGDGPIE